MPRSLRYGAQVREALLSEGRVLPLDRLLGAVRHARPLRANHRGLWSRLDWQRLHARDLGGDLLLYGHSAATGSCAAIILALSAAMSASIFALIAST